MKLKPWQLQLLRFGVVGGTAAAVYVSAGFFFLNILKMSLMSSTVAAFFVSATFSYIGNAFWSFEKGGDVKSVLKFAVLCSIALPVTIAISRWIIETGKPEYYGILVTAIVIPVISFAVQKLWVFRA